MKIVGHKISKILAEKSNIFPKKLSMNTNVDISNIFEVHFDSLTSKEKLIGIEYTFSFTYEPDFAKIEIKGKIILEVEKILGEKIIQDWASKKIESSFHINLVNLLLQKLHLKILQLEEDLELPLHSQIPKISSIKK